MKLESEPVVVGAVGKVKIPPLLRDFQAEGESPVLGLFHGAAFSTALLPTNSAKEPQKHLRCAACGTAVCRGVCLPECNADIADSWARSCELPRFATGFVIDRGAKIPRNVGWRRHQ